MVLLRGCGIKLEAQPFNDRFNTKAVAICPTAIIAGLTMSIGFEREIVPGTTGDYHTNLMNKADAAYDLLYKRNFDFCFLHVKGYDEAGHDRLVDVRIDFVKKIELMLQRFLEHSKNEPHDCVIAITGDHSTPIYYGDHSFEPVQFTISTKQAMVDEKQMFLSDNVEHFDEVEASLGCLGRFPGSEIMPLIFKIRERIEHQGYS